MSFDEEHRGEHDECAHEIHRLQERLERAGALLRRVFDNARELDDMRTIIHDARAFLSDGEKP